MEKAYDENYRYERIKLDANILEQVIFRETGGSKRLNFHVSELRKLDLSEIDFAGVHLLYANLSNTGAKIEEDAVDEFISIVKKLVKARNA